MEAPFPSNLALIYFLKASLCGPETWSFALILKAYDFLSVSAYLILYIPGPKCVALVDPIHWGSAFVLSMLALTIYISKLSSIVSPLTTFPGTLDASLSTLGVVPMGLCLAIRHAALSFSRRLSLSFILYT